MELSTLQTAEAHNEGAEMRVHGPDGAETDFYITLSGIDSEVWRKNSREHKRRAYKSLLGEGEYNEDQERRGVLAAATIGWRGLKSDGEDVEFSIEQAANLYESAPYILDQADNFIGDRVNFMKG